MPRRKKNAQLNKIKFEKKKQVVSKSTRAIAKGKKPTAYDWASLARDVVQSGSAAYIAYQTINSELHWFDTVPMVSTAIADTAWFSASGTNVPFNLLQIPQGDTSTTRTGQSILLKSISGRYTIRSDSAKGTLVRVVIFKVPNILDGASIDPLDYTGNFITGLRDLNETENYQMIYDKVHQLSPAGFNGDVIYENVNIKLDLHAHYDSSATAGPDKNAFYMMACSDTAVADGPPIMTAQFRARYYDN